MLVHVEVWPERVLLQAVAQAPQAALPRAGGSCVTGPEQHLHKHTRPRSCRELFQVESTNPLGTITFSPVWRGTSLAHGKHRSNHCHLLRLLFPRIQDSLVTELDSIYHHKTLGSYTSLKLSFPSNPFLLQSFNPQSVTAISPPPAHFVNHSAHN